MRALRVLPLVLAAALTAGAFAPAPAVARERGGAAPLSQRLSGRIEQTGARAGKVGVKGETSRNRRILADKKLIFIGRNTPLACST